MHVMFVCVCVGSGTDNSLMRRRQQIVCMYFCGMEVGCCSACTQVHVSVRMQFGQIVSI